MRSPAQQNQIGFSVPSGGRSFWLTKDVFSEVAPLVDFSVNLWRRFALQELSDAKDFAACSHRAGVGALLRVVMIAEMIAHEILNLRTCRAARATIECEVFPNPQGSARHGNPMGPFKVATSLRNCALFSFFLRIFGLRSPLILERWKDELKGVLLMHLFIFVRSVMGRCVLF